MRTKVLHFEKSKDPRRSPGRWEEILKAQELSGFYGKNYME